MKNKTMKPRQPFKEVKTFTGIQEANEYIEHITNLLNDTFVLLDIATCLGEEHKRQLGEAEQTIAQFMELFKKWICKE